MLATNSRSPTMDTLKCAKQEWQPKNDVIDIDVQINNGITVNTAQ